MSVDRLEFANLSKRYGDVVALENLEFDVSAGEVFGFVGGNGAGKTTAMRIALGVVEPDRGQVNWREHKVDLRAWRRFGYMPEERGLYAKMKVRDQLVYLAELHGMSNKAAHQSVEEWAERLGVAQRLEDELQKLSLGNQQRVQLAAALVHRPAVLILDEPFSGLDPIAVDVMSKVLRSECDRGVPVLFSSHQLDLVERICDRVGIINKGSMIAVGSVDELRSSGDSRLVIEVDGAPADWLQHIDGVRSSTNEGGRFVIELDSHADEQAILQRAMSYGGVREFSHRKPSLTELFRNVVSEEVIERV